MNIVLLCFAMGKTEMAILLLLDITLYLLRFSYQGQDYALITFLDAPKGIKSTYNFNSSGWNATELARKIVESIVLNANLAKQN